MYRQERIVGEHGTLRQCKHFRMVGPQRGSEGVTETESEEVSRSQIAKGFYAMLRGWTFIFNVPKAQGMI